jgi:hypothetical protein
MKEKYLILKEDRNEFTTELQGFFGDEDTVKKKLQSLINAELKEKGLDTMDIEELMSVDKVDKDGNYIIEYDDIDKCLYGGYSDGNNIWFSAYKLSDIKPLGKASKGDGKIVVINDTYNDVISIFKAFGDKPKVEKMAKEMAEKLCPKEDYIDYEDPTIDISNFADIGL